jgi:hypothetical protein
VLAGDRGWTSVEIDSSPYPHKLLIMT